MTVYTVGGKRKQYETLELAKQRANAIYARTGVIVSIESHEKRERRKILAADFETVGRELDAELAASRALPYEYNMCGSCRRTHGDTESCRIPDAPLYVMANDSFMSGWGPLKHGGINVCVVPCLPDEERLIVEYIERRAEMKYIRVAMNKPSPRGRKLSLLLEWRENALESRRAAK